MLKQEGCVTKKNMAKDENLKFDNSTLQNIDSQAPGLGLKRVGLVGLGSKTNPKTSYRNLGEIVAAAAKFSLESNIDIILASPEELSAEAKLRTLTNFTQFLNL
ncbi:unnamed protein product [Fraxinus pennsylvanica]|uniref:Uncharacterized protein n=1 Tax=Fraxinus pennsylvanica TaxID=56036 RepID=A0AAD1Z1Q5_9LAMI|nr:unnamed protein product [Fraxinus pennsylvanica]